MILFCYGTRPEYIKIKKLIEMCGETIPHKILYVTQHKDIVLGNFDYKLSIDDMCENRLDSIMSSVFLNFQKEFLEGITHILVQGDTATALSLSLIGLHHKKEVIHLEAGLRTYDYNHPYPEEMYRQLISRISNYNLCPTESNKLNLEDEKVHGKNFVVGNTVLDNLNKENITYENKVLITLHRRENHEMMSEWFEVINRLAKDNPELKFILPIHPNPNVVKHKHILTHVEVIEPLSHDKFIEVFKSCKLLISDSGGVQEEASYLNKKVIVCREKTERPESLGKTSFICKKPIDLEEIFYDIINDFQTEYDCPFGDGYSCERIVEIFKKIV
jgi:UDP-N-acetylglucosamine 2-epimerase (non-hydrolysing)